MRLLLAPRRASRRSSGPGRRSHLLGEAGLPRDQTVSATETVMLVLGEDSPLPETVADVEDLALRLRGHVGRLGALTSSREPTLLRAQRLCSDGLPDGYVPSRVHLVELATATQALITVVRAHEVVTATKSPRRRRWGKPPLNILRGSVFALAFACLVLAASVSRR
ncbi:hypothetical protein OKW18_000726 [Streptomyces pratensis]|jgi:hypothetical protein|nr:hypothetical protein [Streptomyces pratensis]